MYRHVKLFLAQNIMSSRDYAREIQTFSYRPAEAISLGPETPPQFERHHLNFIPMCEWRYLYIVASAPHPNNISGFLSYGQRQRRE